METRTHIGKWRIACLDCPSYWILAVVSISLLLRVIFMSAGHLFAEEAYYWNYSRHLDFGYLDHPPMVALLIKMPTLFLGQSEFAVRFMVLLCWGWMLYFSVRLCELIQKGSGVYVVLLLAIMPFYFTYSLIMTPDVPLLACWSAGLYYLYRAVCCERAQAWYGFGVAVGLGMLSKYSISLLVLAALSYVLIYDRRWLLRKEPYIAALLSIGLFTPVIYWNATHDWASFAFQSTRRFRAETQFSLHILLGLWLLFLTPIGVLSASQLFFQKQKQHSFIKIEAKRFISICTLVPLSVFMAYSVRHSVKFNWIGPITLALLPWLAMEMQSKKTRMKGWLVTSLIALMIYCGLIILLCFGSVPWVSQVVLNKYISWDLFTRQLCQVARQIETPHHPVVLIPLDNYSLASELIYYQARYPDHLPYQVIGAHQFGYDSLMYHYWDRGVNIKGKYGIFIASAPFMFDNGYITDRGRVVVSPTQFWAYSQGRNTPVRQYYYEVVKFF